MYIPGRGKRFYRTDRCSYMQACKSSRRTSCCGKLMLFATQMHSRLLFLRLPSSRSFSLRSPPLSVPLLFILACHVAILTLLVVIVVNRKIVTHLPSANTRTGTRALSGSIFRWNIRAKSLGGNAVPVCNQKVLATQKVSRCAPSPA